MDRINLHLGDCLTVLQSLPENSVDSVVTDPPYGIRFMGKAWDGADIDARHAERKAMPSHAPDAGPNGGHKSVAAEAGKYNLSLDSMRAFQFFSEEWARQAMRVLKPGGFLLSFSSPRTYHRMVSGIEDAGFEIRDCIQWVFGSGFPKSHNGPWGGTALKPAYEPVLVARKPLDGTVAANWAEYGTGALNIDACRIEGVKDVPHSPSRKANGVALGGSVDGSLRNLTGKEGGFDPGVGRWPANLIHDGSDEVLAAFPQASGAMSPVKGSEPSAKTANAFGDFAGRATSDRRDGGGSAARFFYCAKASRSDRNEGLAEFEAKTETAHRRTNLDTADNPYLRGKTERQNIHPTVKPTELMAYLVRLVTPAGGLVLDPFMGSGSTGKAAMREGLQFIGIELDASYMDIARARIEFEANRVDVTAKAVAEAAKQASRQFDMFATN